MINKNEMNQFIRIAMATIRSIYKFKPQRMAVASRMYVKWLKLKK